MFIAELPGVDLVVPASHYGQRPQAQGGLYRLVVIHITDGHPDAHGTAEMFAEGDCKTSAHLVIGQDAFTIQCVPLRFAAEHAHHANAYSVGIEHSARSPGSFGVDDPGMPPTEVQLRRSAQIVAYLLKAAGLQPTREFIKGHAEADSETTHSDCPNGCGWPWDDYMRRVAREYTTLGDVTPLVV